MDVQTLRVFVAVARRRSFAAVARDHDLEPSSVSRLVAALEAELGFRLFQRTTRRMELTEAGEAYLHRIETATNQIDMARDEALAVSAGPSGTLRLTASVAFGTTHLVPLLPAFRVSYPRVAIDLLLTDTNLDLVAERVDLAVRLAPSVRAEVIATKLMDTHYRVCAAPSYLMQAPPLRRPSDLAEHRCLLFALPEFRTWWLFRNPDHAEEAVAVAGDIRTSNALALREAARLGMGPALLPDWLIGSDLASGALRDVFPDRAATATDFSTAAWLLYPSRSHLPLKVRATIDFLKQASGQSLYLHDLKTRYGCSS